MYTIIWSASFTRTARKFFQKHSFLKKDFAQLLRDLEKDPSQPQLRLHPLRGKLKGLHAVSFNFSYRITLTLKVTSREIILLDIGSHDDVY